MLFSALAFQCLRVLAFLVHRPLLPFNSVCFMTFFVNAYVPLRFTAFSASAFSDFSANSRQQKTIFVR